MNRLDKLTIVRKARVKKVVFYCGLLLATAIVVLAVWSVLFLRANSYYTFHNHVFPELLKGFNEQGPIVLPNTMLSLEDLFIFIRLREITTNRSVIIALRRENLKVTNRLRYSRIYLSDERFLRHNYSPSTQPK